MFWITENHFLFVGLFYWGNAETQTFSVSRIRDGFALAESGTRKSGTVTPLVANMVDCLYMLMYTVLILSTDLSETNSYFAECIKMPKKITQYYPVLPSNGHYYPVRINFLYVTVL